MIVADRHDAGVVVEAIGWGKTTMLANPAGRSL